MIQFLCTKNEAGVARRFLGLGMIAASLWIGLAGTIAFAQQSSRIGEAPTITQHIDQADVNAGRLSFQQLFAAGERLFINRFNILDGQGRPGATGNFIPDARFPDDRSRFSRTPAFTRASAPNANSCAGCHNQPVIGGAGDFSNDVLEAAPNLDPITESFAAQFGNERNTPGIQGAGPIELLAREMTTELLAIRARAGQTARRTNQPVTLSLDTKGVNFGRITVSADGAVDTRGVQGIDRDLVIKPFSQKGLFSSLRDFNVNAYNALLGMQPVERFGLARTGTDDFDRDGVRDEITVGDITAATVFQAALGIPGRIMPVDPARLQAVQQGEQLFTQAGCASCHRPFLVLNNPVFTEPGPLNPPATLRPADVPQPFSFDLTRDGVFPRLTRDSGGRILVRAFTDLKRHVIGDAQFPWFLNERVVQAGVPTSQFLTRRLWDVGSSDPYGHRGDLTTITEATLAHGGEARQSRDAFAALSSAQQNAIVEFLKTLQTLPDGATSPVITAEEADRLRRRSPGVSSVAPR